MQCKCVKVHEGLGRKKGQVRTGTSSSSRRPNGENRYTYACVGVHVSVCMHMTSPPGLIISQKYQSEVLTLGYEFGQKRKEGQKNFIEDFA